MRNTQNVITYHFWTMALFCLPLVQRNYYVRNEFVKEQYGLNKIANERRELQHFTLLQFINTVSIYINSDTLFVLRYSIGQLLYP
jgi:hypothetical protein